ncbi:NAD(P)-dependent oxidoreductase [Nocardia noduli]|uniref:NAD(P)-dependent oxidoreductase n=1 Tax=Nocardia noduli TaxID=2815722 RepID=UPI001C241309|nr:NAD(P)-dependent oxidoreductase [Nocardia noduli]
MSVAFVGAGRMGLPMVRRLSAAGESVRVLARSDSTREAVGGIARAVAVSTVTEAVDGVEAVIVCVHKDSEVREICLDAGLVDGMPDGSVLIVHTTGSPDTAKDLARVAEPRGVRVVDAPVSGGPDDIARGAVTIFVGGDDAAVSAARRFLGAYGEPLIHVGPLGSGQLMKLVNNSIFLSNIEVIVSATRFGAVGGLDIETMLTCLRQGSAHSAALEGIARAGSPEGFLHSVREFLDKDAAVVREVADSVGADLGAIRPLLTSGSRPPADAVRVR